MSWYRSTPWWVSEELADEAEVAVESAQLADPETAQGSSHDSHELPVPGFARSQVQALRKLHRRGRL